MKAQNKLALQLLNI